MTLLIITISLWAILSLVLLATFNWRRPVISVIIMLLIAGTVLSALESYKFLTGRPHPGPLPAEFELYIYHLDEINNAIDLWISDPTIDNGLQSYRVAWSDKLAEQLSTVADKLDPTMGRKIHVLVTSDLGFGEEYNLNFVFPDLPVKEED